MTISFGNFFKMLRKEPAPAMMFGLRLNVRPHKAVPNGELLLAAHPDDYLEVKEKIHEAFKDWVNKYAAEGTPAK